MAAELDVASPDANTLVLVGELDTHTAPQLDGRLAGVADSTDLVLDVAGLTFISSAGLSVILTAQERLEDSGGSLVVRSPSASVARLISLSGLTERFGLR